MSFKTLIPSIAGCGVEKWSTLFENHVTKWSDAGRPLTGSLGIHYDAREDLSALFQRLNGNTQAMKKHLLDTVIVHPNGHNWRHGPKPLSPLQADVLLDFYIWAQGDQPYFILRKGTQSLGLYRKTSNYFFKNEPDTLPHRISFEFVRPLLADEVRKNLGQIPRTLLWEELELPTPKAAPEQSLEEMVDRLTRTRAAILTLVGDLDAALERFRSSAI